MAKCTATALVALNVIAIASFSVVPVLAVLADLMKLMCCGHCDHGTAISARALFAALLLGLASSTGLAAGIGSQCEPSGERKVRRSREKPQLLQQLPAACPRAGGPPHVQMLLHSSMRDGLAGATLP